MATWNDAVPTASNQVLDDLKAMRENFDELEAVVENLSGLDLGTDEPADWIILAAKVELLKDLTVTASDINKIPDIISGAQALDGLDVDGNADISGTLDVGGNTTIDGTLDIGSDTTKRVAPAGTFVTDSSGYPLITTTSFNVHGITESAWKSIGPTGGGADYTWGALNTVPADADWIKVRFFSTIYHSSNGTFSFNIYGRKNGSSAPMGTYTGLQHVDLFVTTGGSTYAHGINEAIIPITSSKLFDLYWINTASGTSSNMLLVGWGFNP